MSALGSKADMGQRELDVRFVPEAAIGQLFDHLVGAGEQRGRHGEAERLSGL